jgi:iron complex transport system permease protein
MGLNGSAVGRAKTRLLLIVGVGIVSLVLLFFLSLGMGAYPIGFDTSISTFFNVLFNGGQPQQGNVLENIIWNVRLPRTMAVIGVGVGLSIAGAAMQAMIRNPLVDPYITGVSSGAMLGAMLAMLSGVTFFLLDVQPIAAFVGALLAFFFTMALSEASGGKPISFVLSGVMVGIGLSAIANILMTINPDKLKNIIFWMFGSFENMSWNDTWYIILPTIVIVVVILLFARELNVVLLGEEQANQLGVNVKNFKRMTMVLTSVLTAVGVAFTGVIAFLGLIIPHSARMIVGNDHRLLLPATVVLGANVLLVADIVARTIILPSELPIGAIISLIGVPFFAYLLVRRGKEYGA